MTGFNPKIHHRRSIRLKEYDYSQAGLYFITICTHNREPFFGDIDNGKMILNDAGMINGQPQVGQPQGIAPTVGTNHGQPHLIVNYGNVINMNILFAMKNLI